MVASGTGFSLVGDLFIPVVIDPGNFMPLTVRFAPDAEGLYSGILTINSNAGNIEPLTIPLHGQGADRCAQIAEELQQLEADMNDPTLTPRERARIGARIAALKDESTRLGCA
jgi:hypothetical protein